MKMVKSFIVTAALVLMMSATAVANEASVKIEAPTSVKPGTEVTIRLAVSHDGNNFLHHVDWVKLRAGDKLIKTWEYGAFSKPPAGNFVVEYNYTVEEDTQLTAEADCNIHGSAGPDSLMITVEKGDEQ